MKLAISPEITPDYITEVPMKQNTIKNLEDMHFRSVLERLSPNPGAEMLRYGWAREGILSLAQGEGSSKTPDFIADAAYKALQGGKTFYAPALGIPELRQELSTYYQRLMGVSVPTNRIFATSSGTTAMHLALTAILNEGDEIVAITPIWKNLLGAIELTQSKTIQVALEPSEKGWNLDLEKVFDACTHKTKAILVVTPSNPTGWIMPKKDMQALLDFARDRGIWIISDEVYHRLTFDRPYAHSFLEIAKPEDRLFTVNSFSKAYAMTGWRLGWLVGPAQSEDVVRDIALYDNMGPPTYAQYGAVEAVRHGEDFIASQIALWKNNRQKLKDYFDSTGRVTFPDSSATFYAFFKVDGEEDCLAFSKKLIDEAAISIAPGCAFGKCCAGWMRLCFAVSDEKMEDAVQRLKQVIG
jgi:aspartate aminotransferase